MAEQQEIETPDFDSAFAELAAMVEGKEPEEQPEPQQEAAEDTAAADGAPEGEAEAPEDASDDAEDAGDEAGEGADDAPEESELKLSDEDILARFAALVKKAEPQQTEAPKAETKSAPAQEAPLYTQEEEQFLQSYEKDWPDVAKAESLRRRAEYRQLVGYVFQEIAKEIRPVMETVEVLSQRTHLSDLQSTVTDYEDVRDKVIDWVAKQPAYLQPAYNHVITKGTVEEVADLIDRYKRDAGVTQKAAPAAAKRETELPPATKKAAAALAPVSSKRSAVVQAADPNDFESAFASFAEKL